MVALPSPIQVPQALLCCKVLLCEGDALGQHKSLRYEYGKQENLAHVSAGPCVRVQMEVGEAWMRMLEHGWRGIYSPLMELRLGHKLEGRSGI